MNDLDFDFNDASLRDNLIGEKDHGDYKHTNFKRTVFTKKTILSKSLPLYETVS